MRLAARRNQRGSRGAIRRSAEIGGDVRASYAFAQVLADGIDGRIVTLKEPASRLT